MSDLGSSMSRTGSHGMPRAQSLSIIRPAALHRAEEDWATIDLPQEGRIATASPTLSQRRSNRNLDAGSPHESGGGGSRASNGYQEEDAWASMSGTLAAVLAGFFMGLIAVAVEICTKFVSSIRIGVCTGYFWLNKELCCPAEGEGCAEFVTWGDFFGGANERHRYFTDLCAYVALGTMFAGLSSLFCKNYSAYGAGGGINEVKTIVSGQVMNRYFDGWVTFTKSVGVALSTGSGMAVGKEGPFVHLGSCTADLVSGLFPSYQLGSLRRELISAGAGGGLAVAFGAPIGGVVFAIEEINSQFSFRAMLQTLMHGVTAVIVFANINAMHTGRIVQFSINYTHQWFWFEVPLFALVGAFGGLVGSLYNVVNIEIIKRRKTSIVKDWKITEVMLIAAISNVFNYIVPLCTGGLLELLSDSYQLCGPASEHVLCGENEFQILVWLLLAGCVKFCMSVVSVGAFVPCGLLVPSLAIGALFGRAFGIVVKTLQMTYHDSYYFSECFDRSSCIIPGPYAIMGSAAVLTGTTRMTVCLAVIMFELTGGVDYLVPVIVSILCSKWACEAVGVECIYELGIEITKLPYLDPKAEFHHAATVCDIVGSREYTLLTVRGITVGQLQDILEKTVFSGFPLVKSLEEKTLHGFVTRTSLITALTEIAKDPELAEKVHYDTELVFEAPLDGPTATADAVYLNHIIDGAVLQVPPDCSVQRLLYLFKNLGSRMFLVSKLSKFHAVVTKKDMIDFMRKIHHEQEHADHELEKMYKKDQ